MQAYAGSIPSSRLGDIRRLLAEMLAKAGRQYPFHRGRARIRKIIDATLPRGDYLLKARLRRGGPIISVPRPDVMSVHLYSFGDYEQEVVDFLTFVVKRSPVANPVLVDVGANLGTMSVPLAMKLGCHTVSCEPQPHLAELLERNSRTNGVDHLVRVVPTAVGRASGTTTFHIDPGHLATATMAGAPSPGAVELQVKVDRLDTLVSEDEWSRTAVLKVDVEGFERDVFEGAQGLFAKRRPPIVFEINLPALASLKLNERHVVEPLKAAGYRHFHALDSVLYPPKNGVHQPANIVALTDEDAELAKAFGYDVGFMQRSKKFVPFSPLEF